MRGWKREWQRRGGGGGGIEEEWRSGEVEGVVLFLQ